MLSQILKTLSQIAHFFCLLFLLYRGMAAYTGNATAGATAVGTATTTATDAGGCTVTGAAAIIINTRTVTTVAGGTSGATTTTCTGAGAARTTRQLKHNPILKYLHPPPERVTITLPASENNNNRTIK